MSEDFLSTAMRVAIRLTCNRLTDLELAALNNVVQADWDPHNRVFDYEKVASLFTEDDGKRCHEEVKKALTRIVNQRLGIGD